jgi:quercetin dioxygenase-like cupin family protein
VIGKPPQILRASHGTAMPDGTVYAGFAPTPRLPGLAGGVVHIPPGSATWGHNHTETETFAILSGRLRLDWGGGTLDLETGDVVFVGPFGFHSFANPATHAPAALLSLSRKEPSRTTIPAAETETVHLLAVHRGAAGSAADIAARALHRRGRAVRLIELSQDADASALVERLRAGGALDGPVLDLERHRALLGRALDRVTMTADVKRAVARALDEGLPDFTAADLKACAGLIEALAPRPAKLALFFPARNAAAYALLVPFVLTVLDAAPIWPIALHAETDELPGKDRIAPWQTWADDLGARLGRLGMSPSVEAGRWSARHHAALGELRALSALAAGALEPESFSAEKCVAALDAIVACMRALAEAEPYLACTESLEAEGRTTLALEAAAAATLARLAAPLAPAFGESLAAAFAGASLKPALE